MLYFTKRIHFVVGEKEGVGKLLGVIGSFLLVKFLFCVQITYFVIYCHLYLLNNYLSYEYRTFPLGTVCSFPCIFQFSISLTCVKKNLPATSCSKDKRKARFSHFYPRYGKN